MFSDEERRGVYRAIYERRDVRSHFLPEPIPGQVLLRILDAADEDSAILRSWATT